MYSYFQFYPIYIVLFIVAVVPLLFAFYSRKGNRGETSKYFLWLMLACFFYSLGNLLELLAVGIDLKQAMLKVQYSGAVFFGPMMLIFTLKYTNSKMLRFSARLSYLFVIPFFNLILVSTNSSHYLFYKSFSLIGSPPFESLISVKNWGYWLHQGYTIALLFISLGLLANMVPQVPKHENKQVYMVILGLSFPFLLYIWHLTGTFPYQLDPIPFGFLGMAVFVFMGLKKYRLFKIAPIAYRTLFDNMKEGVIVTDKEGNFESYNLSAQKILGIQQPHDVEEIKENWPELLEVLQMPTPHAIKEMQRTEEGYQRWYLLTRSEILDNQDKNVGRILMVRDISQEKNYQLELEKARVAAEDANKAKSEFLANMSHEIRTPLNGVIGFTELLSNTRLNEQQARYAETALNSANALLDLINDILDLAKIEAGKIEISVKKTDLYELLDTIIDVLSFQAHQKGLELILDLAPDVPRFVYVDELKLKQVLINLLNNALKFTPSGVVKLCAKALEKKSNEGDKIILRFIVVDTGIGIEKDKQQLVFEAFSQADSSTTKKFGGTGLGLTISNKLLFVMGSQIQMESKPQEGSRFFFDITLGFEKNLEIYSDFGHLSKVLLIESNAQAAVNMMGYCERFGMACCYTENITEAFNWVESKEEFRVIMLSHKSLGLNSVSAMQTLMNLVKHWKRFPKFVALLCSHDQQETIDKYKSIGCHSLLVKPITLKKLEELFRQLSMNGDTGGHHEGGAVQKKKVRLLLVEDNAVNSMLIKIYVKRLYPDTEVIGVENGKKALEFFIQEPPDMVITDIHMPEMDGFELCAAIRDYPTDKYIPVIGFSANGLHYEKRMAATQERFDDCLYKPVTQKGFAEVMEKWMPK